MKDLHTHILYGIDDGAKTLAESLEILKKASINGVTDIILTPHYIKNSIYNANNKEKDNLLTNLKKELIKNKININLYLGNEVYLDEDIPNLLNKDIKTINDSRYILIELPITNKSPILNEVLYNIKQANLIPIIAHPERYLRYYKDYNFYNELINQGCLLQANIGSLYGIYGRRSKKMFKELLKRKMIHFIASDIHHANNNLYDKNMKKDLIKIVKDDKIVEDLLINNISRVLKDEQIYGVK